LVGDTLKKYFWQHISKTNYNHLYVLVTNLCTFSSKNDVSKILGDALEKIRNISMCRDTLFEKPCNRAFQHSNENFHPVEMYSLNEVRKRVAHEEKTGA
jgi:hypothetical protein